MKYKAIIGLGFGDEGKGLFTDYLSASHPNSLVVRYNGGQQAGHTVVSQNFRHVFSNFGSGTFRGIPSYFSKYCTVYPLAILKELEILISKGINPVLYIDKLTPVTTPLDIAFNQKYSSYGTVGVGFGSTLQREENLFSLKFLDLYYSNVFQSKLENIRSYYNEFRDLDIRDFINSIDIIKKLDNIKISDGLPKQFDSYIFEGAQGLLLDKDIGFFPFVTRSNTGSVNIVNILGNQELEFFLITRAYQTRHGMGPLSNEGIPNNIKLDLLETNIENRYQGKFRYGILDLSLLEYAIQRDEYILNSKDKNLVITCLDQIESEYRFTYEDKIIYSSNEMEFVSKIAEILKIKNVYISRSDISENIKKLTFFQNQNQTF